MMNWGILGTAKINEKIVPLLEMLPDANCSAVASRDLQKAQTQSKLLNIKKSYGSYDELLKDTEIDVVYNSLPNSLHAEWTIKALQAGKHVLCEKPLALRSSDVKNIIELRAKNKLIVMEGLMYRHHAQTDWLKTHLPKLGSLKTIKFSFHTILQGGPNIRWSKELGGGALWDLGCYAIHFLRSLIGAEAKVIQAKALKHNEVDQYFWTWLDFGNNCTAFVDCGFNQARREHLEIIGEEAIMLVPHPIKATSNENIVLLSKRNESQNYTLQHSEDPYFSQLKNFMNAIEDKQKALISVEDSFHNVQTLESIQDCF
jgi:predicted dehydrogenase